MDRSQQTSCSAASRNLASLAHTNVRAKDCLEFKKHLKHNTDFGHFILYLNYIYASC